MLYIVHLVWAMQVPIGISGMYQSYGDGINLNGSSATPPPHNPRRPP